MISNAVYRSSTKSVKPIRPRMIAVRLTDQVKRVSLVPGFINQGIGSAALRAPIGT